MPGKPAKPPKPVMRWGVYNKRGILIGMETKKHMAQEWDSVIYEDGYARRVKVTPIASKAMKGETK